MAGIGSAIDTAHSSERDAVLAYGSDKSKLDILRRLITEQISAYQHRGNVVICGSATLTERLHAKLALGLLNGDPTTVEALTGRIAAAIEADGPRTKKRLAPENDLDLAGPYNLLPSAKRHPGQNRVSQYGLCPDARYNAPQDAYERAATPASQLATLNRIVPDAPEDENFGEKRYQPDKRLDVVATLDQLDERFFWAARESGLVLIVKRDLTVGITSRRLIETALQMSQELISAEAPAKRKSRAKMPLFPAWTQVANRLGLHPKTAQIAIRALKTLPPSKLFELLPKEDSL